jgi:hypothetical protein
MKALIPKVFLLVLATTTNFVSSELPPGAYEQLKAKADDVLLLEMTDVTSLGVEVNGCTEEFRVQATINQVERTLLGYTPGKVIDFASNVIKYGNPECAGFAGPRSPPLLQAGCTSSVYLNQPMGADDTDSMVLSLAAYGESFENLDCSQLKTAGNSSKGGGSKGNTASSSKAKKSGGSSKQSQRIRGSAKVNN